MSKPSGFERVDHTIIGVSVLRYTISHRCPSVLSIMDRHQLTANVTIQIQTVWVRKISNIRSVLVSTLDQRHIRCRYLGLVDQKPPLLLILLLLAYGHAKRVLLQELIHLTLK